MGAGAIPKISLHEIRQAAIKVERLQNKIRRVFFLLNSDAKDFRLLGDFPSSGSLECDGKAWSYKKHGLGYRFLSEHGQVVDVHNHLKRNSCVLDAHRLTEYLLSTHANLGHGDMLHAHIENGLTVLEKEGFLIRTKTAPPSWQLAPAAYY